MSNITFSSKTASILTIIGVAVGLGNVWRFPYMMGQYGGSAFLFIYLIFIFLFGIPALTGEFALGRYTRGGPVGAFIMAFGHFFGKPFAWFIVTTIFIANSYYLLVIGNITYLVYHSGFHGFESSLDKMNSGLNDRLLQYFIALALLIACLGVIYRGLRKGIEMVSKAIIPFFGLVMIYLIAHSLSLPGASQHLLEFLQPDFAALTPRNIFAAMGQAFFTLSLGGTLLITYGSFIQKDASLTTLAVYTGLGDLSAALLAALFIVPTILVYQLDMQEGYTLLFTTLPHVFGQMPSGRILGTLFMVALLLVAFLSSLAVIQLCTKTLSDNTKFSFVQALILVGIAEAILMIPSAFNPDIIGTLDLIFGSGMQVLGSCIALIALCWGLGKGVAMTQIFQNKPDKFHQFYFTWLKWIVPTGLIFTLLLYIYDRVLIN
ncbi:sodium-dependent transporter [bacterium AH-315-C07]|nr:sodium-dependent transporter [bacterium AH-315-C07]